MKQFICLLLFYGSTVSQDFTLFTTDYLLQSVHPKTPHLPERLADDSTSHTSIGSNYHFNLLYHETMRSADTLRHHYAAGAHTWNLQFVHSRPRWQAFAAWQQHSLTARFAPESDYKTSVIVPRHFLILGGNRIVSRYFSARATATIDPFYFRRITADKTLNGVQTLNTVFATPGINLSASVFFRTTPFTVALNYENSSPFNSTTELLNTTSNSNRTLHCITDENRIGTFLTFDRARHRLSLRGSIGRIDSSMYTLSENQYPVIAKGHSRHASFDYSPRIRFSPNVYLSYAGYRMTLRGFDNTLRSYSRINGTRLNLLNGAVSLRQNIRKTIGAFFTHFSSEGSSGSIELYPFSSWITLINLNRYYITAAHVSWQEYGLFFRYRNTLSSRHTLNANAALSGSRLEAAASTAEGNLAFGGLLLVKENDQRKTLNKNFLLIKAAVSYSYRWNRYTPAITVQQYLPIEIKRNPQSTSSAATTSSDVNELLFGGFRVSCSLSRDIPDK